MSAESEPDLPDPTALAFSALTGGQVQFYAATAGRESAELVALSLGIEEAIATALRAVTPVQLVPLHDIVAAAGGDGADADDRGYRARNRAGEGRAEALAVGAVPARDGGSRWGRVSLSQRGGGGQRREPLQTRRARSRQSPGGAGCPGTVAAVPSRVDERWRNSAVRTCPRCRGIPMRAAGDDREGSTPSSSLPCAGCSGRHEVDSRPAPATTVSRIGTPGRAPRSRPRPSTRLSDGYAAKTTRVTLRAGVRHRF